MTRTQITSAAIMDILAPNLKPWAVSPADLCDSGVELTKYLSRRVRSRLRASKRFDESSSDNYSISAVA